MKLQGNKNVSSYAARLFVLAPIMISLIISRGHDFVSKGWVYLGVGLLLSAAFLLYWRSAKKPFAEISGESLIVNSVRIDKSKIKRMEYWVHSSAKHELRVHMDGYNEWQLNLTTEDVDLDGIPLYKFIRDNYYPLKLVKV